MDAEDMDGQRSDDYHVGYSDDPSQAWVRTAGQHVLIKERYGAVAPFQIAIVRKVLGDAARIEQQPARVAQIRITLSLMYMLAATSYAHSPVASCLKGPRCCFSNFRISIIGICAGFT